MDDKEESKETIRAEAKQARRVLDTALADCFFDCSVKHPCTKHFWWVQAQLMLEDSLKKLFGDDFLCQ